MLQNIQFKCVSVLLVANRQLDRPLSSHLNRWRHHFPTLIHDAQREVVNTRAWGCFCLSGADDANREQERDTRHHSNVNSEHL